jgi:hypothetical protein
MVCDNDSAAAAKAAAGAPEIEITPAMIKAGVRAWAGPNDWYDPSPSDLVREVYLAMEAARRSAIVKQSASTK